MEALVRRVDQCSRIARGKERPRKTIGNNIERDLNFIGLNVNMIYDSTLWHRLIHVADST